MVQFPFKLGNSQKLLTKSKLTSDQYHRTNHQENSFYEKLLIINYAPFSTRAEFRTIVIQYY